MIVGTDSDKDEDLECYMKQREKLNQGTHRSTSLSAKTTQLIQDSQNGLQKMSKVALHAIVGGG